MINIISWGEKRPENSFCSLTFWLENFIRLLTIKGFVGVGPLAVKGGLTLFGESEVNTRLASRIVILKM